MAYKYKPTPQDEYENALREMDDPNEPDTDFDFVIGLKLLTMKKSTEYLWFVESLAESPDSNLEDIMSWLRAALVDNTTDHDEIIGALVRRQLTEYLRPTVTKDYEEYMERMGENESDEAEYRADQECDERWLAAREAREAA